MEQKRKLLILSSVLALLVITFIIGLFFNAERKYNRNYAVQLFPNLTEEEVYGIELQSDQDEKVVLTREKGEWKVIIEDKVYPGDEVKVENFLKEVIGLKTRRFVTENDARYEELGLGKQNKAIRLFDGEGRLLEEILIGNSEGSEDEYIRSADSNKVYTVEPRLSFYTAQEDPYWSELLIFPESLKDEKIIRIDIQCENLKLEDDKPPVTADYTLISVTGENGNSGWRFGSEDERDPSPDAVLSLINACTGLRGERFVTEELPRNREGLASLELTTGSNSVYRFFVKAQSDDESYLCGTDMNSFTYELRNWNLARIFKPIEEISGP